MCTYPYRETSGNSGNDTNYRLFQPFRVQYRMYDTVLKKADKRR